MGPRLARHFKGVVRGDWVSSGRVIADPDYSGSPNRPGQVHGRIARPHGQIASPCNRVCTPCWRGGLVMGNVAHLPRGLWRTMFARRAFV